MISPEILRRFPFFAPFTEEQLIEISMISDIIEVEKDTIIFDECQPATAIYLLMEGNIDLFFKSEDSYDPNTRKELTADDINIGEVIALSSLIEPYVLSTNARATQPSKLIKIDAVALREMLDKDCRLGYMTMQQVAKALMERLAYTRVQLAAAWA